MSVLDDFAEEEVVENPTLRAAYNAEPLHQNEPLHWDYEVNLIGEKIYDKTIHLCEVCELPILVYGRMLPCKHIFCFDCARKCDKVCIRCKYKVQKVEKSALGTVYVCTHGAPKHSTKGCRRTYLSQRDLHSHHAHRHLPKASSSGKSGGLSGQASIQPSPNQLPMTQQQAQQASQQKQSMAVGQSAVGARGLLSPSQGQMVGMLAVSSASQASPLIPGLGGLTTSLTGQTSQSPHLQPSMSSKPPSLHQPQQNLGLSYSGQPIQNNPSDIYRPVDLGNVLPNNLPQQQQQQPHRHMHQPQLQQQQQQHGLHSSMQPGLPGSQQSFGQPSHFQHTPPPTQLPQQMGVGSVQQAMLSPGLHMGQQQQQQQQHHQHQQQQHQQQRHGLSVSQHMETFSPQNPPPIAVSSPLAMTMANNVSQSRTNNLITVPIQDEGQYRPLPFVNTSLGGQPGTQSWQNSGSFAHGMPPGGFHTKHGGVTESMMGGAGDTAPGLAFSQGQGSSQNINFSSADGGHHPGMGMNFGQLRGQTVPPRLGFNQPGLDQGNAGGMPPFSQSLPGMGAGVGGAGGGNISQGLVRAISMVAAATRPHPVSGGPGMRHSGPGIGGQTVGRGTRFQGPPSGRWPSPRGMQPRMGGSQAQPRSHDGFNQGPYYN
ncbi:hypothetical protein EGW08_004273 [Elysia chlorotica]|uniref:E3 ubiquitin-protein ligase Hakai n=1 Tax=Elysia chlorotica TaxID=188477 RepID=A0A433U2G4_ELYCH|nr:hypothetical protein EGW08_004273 [Elysia chlorotica]